MAFGSFEGHQNVNRVEKPFLMQTEGFKFFDLLMMSMASFPQNSNYFPPSAGKMDHNDLQQ